jgi:hypothetical protein
LKREEGYEKKIRSIRDEVRGAAFIITEEKENLLFGCLQGYARSSF